MLDPRCPHCRELLSVDDFDPARKELRCAACGRLAVVIRGRAPRGSVPVPSGLTVRQGRDLVVRWRRRWTELWRPRRLRVTGSTIAIRGGLVEEVADLAQVYAVRDADRFTLRAIDRGGEHWPVMTVDTIWEALAVEHLIEEHLEIEDRPVDAG